MRIGSSTWTVMRVSANNSGTLISANQDQSSQGLVNWKNTMSKPNLGGVEMQRLQVDGTTLTSGSIATIDGHVLGPLLGALSVWIEDSVGQRRTVDLSTDDVHNLGVDQRQLRKSCNTR